MAKKDEIEISVQDVVDLIKMEGGYVPALSSVVGRRVTADAAAKAGIKVTKAQLQKAVDNFRLMNGLSKASDTENWLKAHAVSVENLEEWIETNILISKFKDLLEKEANSNKFLSHPEVKSTIRTLIYEEWLAKNLK